MADNIRVKKKSDRTANAEALYQVSFSEEEKEMLFAVASELSDAVEDTSIKRLYPPAHLDSKKLQKDYKKLTLDYLLSSRRKNLKAIPSLLQKTSLTEEELSSLAMGINILRLIFAYMLESSKIDLFTAPSGSEKESAIKSWTAFQALNSITEDLSDFLCELAD